MVLSKWNLYCWTLNLASFIAKLLEGLSDNLSETFKLSSPFLCFQLLDSLNNGTKLYPALGFLAWVCMTIVAYPCYHFFLDGFTL